MVTEVGAAISDWDRDRRMRWLAGKHYQTAARFVSLYMRVITSRKLLQKLKVVFEKADVVTGQICCKYFQSPLHNSLNTNISCIILTIRRLLCVTTMSSLGVRAEKRRQRRCDHARLTESGNAIEASRYS